MIDGCRCRFMSQRTVCVICVSPSACLALLRGRGRGFDSTNRECICPTASRLNEFCREPSATRYVYFEFKATSILSKSVISRNREHHALGGAESFTFLPLLFVRSAHLTSAERVSQLARRQPTLGRHHKQPSIILLLRLLMHTSMT